MHVRRLCSIGFVDVASDLEYKHTLSFSSSKVKRLSRTHDDALMLSLNMANIPIKEDIGRYEKFNKYFILGNSKRNEN